MPPYQMGLEGLFNNTCSERHDELLSEITLLPKYAMMVISDRLIMIDLMSRYI
jgi:hypothetical protein